MSQTASRTLWEQGREPGRDVVALGVALAFTVACLDLTMTGRIGGVFDVGFVMVSIAIALLVRPRDLFTVGVLPPLLMLVTLGLLAFSRSQAIVADGSGVPAIVTALGDHSEALVVGYALCLTIVAIRRRFTRSETRRRRPF